MASLRQRLGLRVAALLGISAYVGNASRGPQLDDADVIRAREILGGQLQPIPFSQTRWYLDDLEAAEINADMGHLAGAARLMRSARKDGILAGVLSTRTAGLVRLPKKFSGLPNAVAALDRAPGSARSVFDEMCPPSELAAMAADGMLLGVAVGELVPVPGRDYPVLVRLDPEFLVFRWDQGIWYFRSIAGLIPITPGDGRWVLHTPGGRIAPWQSGLWRCVGRAYITKDHAREHRDNWEAKLANPARVAVAPSGASEARRQSWFRQVMAWGVNTVFALDPGYDVRLLESNGRGSDSFRQTISEQNEEFIIAVAGQVVTTTGGTGFANADIHKSIRADLIKATADDLAFTVNTQILPQWVVEAFGEEALDDSVAVEWDVTPPKDLAQEANAQLSAANAIVRLTEAFAAHGRDIDVDRLAEQYSIPLKRREVEASAPVSLRRVA